ncbi:MAG: tetratricopeptide repeat protein [Panacagrimonas sp.]
MGDLGSGGILDPRRLEALGITRLGFTHTVDVLRTSSGTPLYFAPELLAGQPPTVQADIYSLGVMLYQMVVGDLYRPLTAGWEREIQDELLRADIAAAAEGDPEHRLVNAGELARRLRTLDERRAQLATERKAHEQAAKQKLAAERMQARRTALMVAFATMALGLVISTWLYFDARTARAQAEKNAAQAQTVANFLAKDMFSVVGSRPLRDLTVPELLDAASGVLSARMENQPAAAAQIHAALGHAYWKMERPADAEKHLDQALALFERLGGAGSEAAVSSAGQLVVAQGAVGKSPPTMERFDSVLARGREQLGPGHPQVLKLNLDIAHQRFSLGEWRHAADDLRRLIEDAKSDAEANRELLGSAEIHLGRALASLGQFKASAEAQRESLSHLGAGATSVELAMAHLFLGQSLIELERFGEAESELSRALEIFRPWVVGENSVQLMSVQFLLGQLRLRQGRADESVAILEKVVAAAAALDWTRTADHTYEYRAWLARAYDGAGHKEMALPTMQKALEVSLGTLGPRHPMSQNIRLGLADILRRTSGPAAARTALAAVDLQVLTGLGPDHPLLAELRRVEGLLALAEQRPDEARRNLSEAQRIYELRYGPAHAFSRRAAAELAQTVP